MSGLCLPSPLLVCPGAALVLWVTKTRSFPCNTSLWGSAKFLPFGGGGQVNGERWDRPRLLRTAQAWRSCCYLRNAPLMLRSLREGSAGRAGGAGLRSWEG